MTDSNSSSNNPHREAGVRGASPFRIWLHKIIRPFLAVLGLVLIVISVPIALASPLIPIGLPIGIVGVLLLGTNSVMGRNWMESVLHKRPWIERMAPHWLMRMVFQREKRDFKKGATDQANP